MIDALVFDLDGTLLDTLDDISEVVNTVFREEGLPSQTREQVRLAVGKGVEHLVRELVPEPEARTDRIPYLAERVRRVYLDMGSVMTRPYPGIPELLRELTDRGFPMAVLTNKPQASADESIATYFGDFSFRMVRGAKMGFPLKPSSEAVEPVLDALGHRSGNVAMVGDSDVDMATALNSGMMPVGVSWGFRDAELLRVTGAEAIVHRPAEVLGLL